MPHTEWYAKGRRTTCIKHEYPGFFIELICGYNIDKNKIMKYFGLKVFRPEIKFDTRVIFDDENNITSIDNASEELKYAFLEFNLFK